MPEANGGWFADYCDENDMFPGCWQAFYQYGGSVFSVDIGWSTKEDCEEFINETLISGAKRLTR